jgi:enoyl-CoA hydratase/carnithine racemase
MELLLSAESINAQRAYEMGLVNRIVKREKLMPMAEEMAKNLCQKGPLCLRAMKEVYYRCRDMDNHSALALVERVFAPVMNSEDAAEGKKAFMEKRKPRWKDR